MYTVTQFDVFHRNMQHYWHSPSRFLISNRLIRLRFFVVQLGGPKYKSTYKEHVRCFYNYPSENTLSGLVSERLAKTVQATCVTGTLYSLTFSFRIVRVLHCLPLTLLNEKGNSGCFLRMSVWTTLQLMLTLELKEDASLEGTISV